METDLLRGDWIDPRRGQELFEMWAAMWMETLASRKPKTRESYESIGHCHLPPRFAATPIAAIDYPCVPTPLLLRPRRRPSSPPQRHMEPRPTAMGLTVLCLTRRNRG